LQVVLPKHCKKVIVETLVQTHPYETVAYELFPIENVRTDLGMGCIGMLEEAMDEAAFLGKLKAILGTPSLRHSGLTGKKIERVALLGGSGSFAIEAAIRQGADAFVTADLKYHDFFKGENNCLLVDVGHYESEQFTKNTIIEVLRKKFPSFAVISSKTVTNPVYYF